ncbi:probable prolyl 4-hydroxylase 9 [Dendrobium catenatum]|uniref:procollagen-proline 4-dioxygenase n=1 Tax=Dendrobium catenatum TaxID=906689 RepID=A0A2I0VRA2_9ASPA|nr:probable prolyl 4-hydroxylase 9 [Dendrobium catenatum]PKU65942.1 prolyl 4-hydroxylase [Dendrobium catenatum]
MRGAQGRPVLRDLERAKLGLPLALFFCLLFFFVGFFGSMFVSQDFLNFGRVRRVSLMELSEVDVGAVEPATRYWASREAESGIPFQILSWRPRAVYFPKFATLEQCLSIIKNSRSKLSPSTLALRDGETAENTKGIRTSTGAFISKSDDSSGTLNELEEKIARVTMIPRSQGEDFYILRYQIGQRYASHYDAFSPAEYGPQKSQRIATFLIYLSDVEEGGETMFPYENGSNMDIEYDYFKCIGLTVKPSRGDGLLFYSVFTNGTIDLTSLHGSCPVIKGEKWVATKWLRDQTE